VLTYEELYAQIAKERKALEERVQSLNGQIGSVKGLELSDEEKAAKIAGLESQRNATKEELIIVEGKQKAVEFLEKNQPVMEVTYPDQPGGMKPNNVDVKMEEIAKEEDRKKAEIAAEDRRKVADFKEVEEKTKAAGEERAKQAGEHGFNVSANRFQEVLNQAEAQATRGASVLQQDPHNAPNPFKEVDAVSALTMAAVSSVVLVTENLKASAAREERQAALAEEANAKQQAMEQAAAQKAEAAKQEMTAQMKEQLDKPSQVPQVEQTAKEMAERQKFEEMAKQREQTLLERCKEKTEEERREAVDKLTKILNEMRATKEAEWAKEREQEAQRREQREEDRRREEERKAEERRRAEEDRTR
jgi:hypothetical protein